jgi:hypothetical protein
MKYGPELPNLGEALEPARAIDVLAAGRLTGTFKFKQASVFDAAVGH